MPLCGSIQDAIICERAKFHMSGHYITPHFQIVASIVDSIVASPTSAMGRKPIIQNHPKAIHGKSTNQYSLNRRNRDANLEQWRYDLQQAMQRDRGRRHNIKRAEEGRKYTKEIAAAHYRAGRIQLLDAVREILDVVMAEEHESIWIQKDVWEKEKRRSVSNMS